MTGHLIVFEGPDGVGKTTLSKRLVEWLQQRGKASRYISFPGSAPGTLGKLVYDVHHSPKRFQIEDIDPTSRQLLHVAAHIDALRTSIKPMLSAGEVVVMDRFWWSTIVYGRITGVDEDSLRLMMELEKLHWARWTPTVLFLLDRETPSRSDETLGEFTRLRRAYSQLAKEQESSCAAEVVSTDAPIDETFDRVSSLILTATDVDRRGTDSQSQESLPFIQPESQLQRRAPTVFTRLAPAVPSEVYDTYWRFAAERQAIFFRRFRNAPPPWTEDDILRRFKFTNAYRASDRVSQYAIRHVVYSGDQSPREVFFRTILFKLFNKIETWELLTDALGMLTTSRFDLRAFDNVLTAAMARRTTIYSAAYIMPSGGKNGNPKKHCNHLQLLAKMLADGVPERLAEAKRMRDAFELLLGYPMIGSFLAYQFLTDLNYGSFLNFSEMEFAVPGPGARDGIKKCFRNLGGLSEADVIKMVADRQELEFERLELRFQSLWGRPLQLIDCQNLFCEVDKYARHAHPDAVGYTQRTRIKQTFRSTPTAIEYWYPPKWGINGAVSRDEEEEHVHV